MVLHIRKADASDLRFYYELRNDPSVRATAFSTEEVAFETHERWFHAKLNDSNADLFVIEYDGAAVGQIRLDVSGDQGELHIALATSHRGHGYATEGLRRVCREAFEARPSLRKLIARVRHDNDRSLRAFNSAGFTDSGDEGPTGEICRTLGMSRAAAETPLNAISCDTENS